MFPKYGLYCLLAALLFSVCYAGHQQQQPQQVEEGDEEQQQQDLSLLATHLKGLDLASLPYALNFYKPTRTPTKRGGKPPVYWPPYYPPGWPYPGYPYPYPPHHTHPPHTPPPTKPPTMKPTEPPTKPPTEPPTKPPPKPTLSPIIEALLCKLYPDLFCPKPTVPPTLPPNPKPTIPTELEDWICNKYPTLCRNTRLLYDPNSNDPEFENAMRELLASGLQGRSSPQQQQPTKRQKFVNAKKQEKDK